MLFRSKNNNGSMFVAGSGSEIYKSANNVDAWEKMVDLNLYNEDIVDISGIKTMCLYQNNLVVGTNNGNVFAQNYNGNVNIKLIQP